MNDPKITRDVSLALAEELVEKIQATDEPGVVKILDRLNMLYKGSLFSELCQLTQRLNEAMGGINFDEHIAELARNELPSAMERLHKVVRMTDEAASKTLESVEAAIPACDALEKRAHRLSSQWEKFVNGEMTVEQFRELSTDIRGAMLLSANESSLVRSHLSEILMAQEYQDLTGQIIHHVVKLVDEVHEGLVNLVRAHGRFVKSERTDKVGVAAGQNVEEEESEVSGQNDVDRLLSEMGR